MSGMHPKENIKPLIPVAPETQVDYEIDLRINS